MPVVRAGVPQAEAVEHAGSPGRRRPVSCVAGLVGRCWRLTEKGRTCWARWSISSTVGSLALWSCSTTIAARQRILVSGLVGDFGCPPPETLEPAPTPTPSLAALAICAIPRRDHSAGRGATARRPRPLCRGTALLLACSAMARRCRGRMPSPPWPGLAAFGHTPRFKGGRVATSRQRRRPFRPQPGARRGHLCAAQGEHPAAPDRQGDQDRLQVRRPLARASARPNAATGCGRPAPRASAPSPSAGSWPVTARRPALAALPGRSPPLKVPSPAGQAEIAAGEAWARG